MILAKEQILNCWNRANAQFNNEHTNIIKQLENTLKDNYAYICKYETDTGDMVDVDDYDNYIKEHPEVKSVIPRYIEVCYIGDLPDATEKDLMILNKLKEKDDEN